MPRITLNRTVDLPSVRRKVRAVSQSGRTINAREVLRDINAGMSRSSLMEKYKLSSRGLESLYAKMRSAGLLKEASPESAPKTKESRPTEALRPAAKTPPASPATSGGAAPGPALAWTCPACGRQFESEHSECPACGVVVSKLAGQAGEDQPPPHLGVHQRYSRTAEQYESYDEATGDRGTSVELMLGVAGAVVLFLAAFTPIIKVPVAGGLSYFQIGKLSQGASMGGYVLIVLAGASLALVLVRRWIGLWFTGLGALGVLGFTYMRYRQGVRQAMNQMNQLKEKFQAGTPPGLEGKVDLGKFADQMTNQLQNLIQMDWGWVVVLIGSALLLTAAFIATKNAARA